MWSSSHEWHKRSSSENLQFHIYLSALTRLSYWICHYCRRFSPKSHSMASWVCNNHNILLDYYIFFLFAFMSDRTVVIGQLMHKGENEPELSIALNTSVYVRIGVLVYGGCSKMMTAIVFPNRLLLFFMMFICRCDEIVKLHHKPVNRFFRVRRDTESEKKQAFVSTI